MAVLTEKIERYSTTLKKIHDLRFEIFVLQGKACDELIDIQKTGDVLIQGLDQEFYSQLVRTPAHCRQEYDLGKVMDEFDIVEQHLKSLLNVINFVKENC